VTNACPSSICETVITAKDILTCLGTSDEEKQIPAIGACLDEKDRLIAMLKQNGNNKKEAARLLGIDRSTLYRKLQKYELM